MSDKKTCIHCGGVTLRRMVRGYCLPCYTREKNSGRLESINTFRTSWTECIDCGGPFVEGPIKGMCRPCYFRKYKGSVKRKDTKCRRCKGELDSGSRWSLCSVCVNIKEGVKPPEVLERVKMLTIKWKWGYLLPWEHFEIASIWVEWYSKNIQLRLDGQPINKQIEIMIADFKVDLQN